MNSAPEPNSPPNPSAQARRLALGALGLAALGAGAWWSLKRPQASASDPLAALWQQAFDTPQGGLLKLAQFDGRPLLLNFWASWCPPCVKEMPLLDRFQREFGPKGWQVVALAVDNAPPVREFLAKTSVSFPVAVAGFGGAQWASQLGNTSGGLPFTAVFDHQRRQTVRHSGEVRWADLSAWQTALNT